MAELNIVEKANKIISFRKAIRDICRKKGLEYPSDAKIAEYIADCGGDECVYDINDFMGDYESKIGVFRDPLEDFKAEIKAISWSTPPTEEEVTAFFEKHGNDIGLFCKMHTIKKMKPLERKVYLNVIEKCSVPQLVGLWNCFIEESAIYGQDSHIFDLTFKEDSELLNDCLNSDQRIKIHALEYNGIRYLHCHFLNDKNNIKGYTDNDIIDTITAYWREIFERLLVWDEIYNNSVGNKGTDQEFNGFFDIVVRPILLKELGYEFDTRTFDIKEIKKS